MTTFLIDEALLAKLRQCDHASWASVYEQFGPRLHAYVARHGGEGCEVEDVVQETMLAAVRSFSGYTAQAHLLTWMCGIANYKIADHWRRRRRPTLSLPAQLPAPARGEGWLGEALDHMPADYRAALLLRYMGGFSVGEIAQRLGRSYKATESLLSRARTLLRSELVEHVA